MAHAARHIESGTAGLTVRPLTARIGAEIDGIDATRPIPPAQAAELNALLNTWKVIFFRDQPVTKDQHRRFAETFGPVMSDYYLTKDASDHPEIQVVKPTFGNVSKWHTDTSWMVRPSKCAVLHGVVIPEVGGDTVWADGVAAYEGLPDDVKIRIDELDAIHDAARIGVDYGKDDPRYPEKIAKARATRRNHPLVAQPIVRTHPETGEKSLFLNANLCTYIAGLAPDESRALLDYLLAEYARPEYSCRFRWQPHSIAVWDQRQTQHYAINDYPMGTPRELHRILVSSDDVPHR